MASDNNDKNSNLPEKPEENKLTGVKKSLYRGQREVKERINEYRKNKEIKSAENDIIFSEPLSMTKSVPKPLPLTKGSIDMWFLLWAMLLISFGVIMSYSASTVYAERYYDSTTYFLWRYIMFTIVSVVVTIPFVMLTRPWFWRIVGVGAYIASLILLVAVIVVGTSGGGAQRWIEVGPISIQPSEIAKMAVIMVLALYMSKHEKQITSTHKFGGNFKHGVLIPMLIIGTVCVLIALEKHISGLMIVGMIGLAVMFLGGTRPKWLILFLCIIAVAGVALILVSDYAQDRVAIWLHIDQVDPLGDAWQTLQGLYAMGSGSFFGLGLGNSRQKYGYISEPQNDFIFTVICEELGFVGAFLVLLLFALLIWRGIKIGQRAPDKFSSLVVLGLTFKIALQVAMNIAVVTNSMPNTGISLPFFSSGGSSLVIQIFEIGIILSISRFSVQKK